MTANSEHEATMSDFTGLLHSTMPLAAALGMTAHEFSPDLTILELEWREDLCTSNAIMHGGALMALADCAGAACAVQHLPEGATEITNSGRLVAKTTQTQAVLR